ncbi:MAG TPA: hypothetical protein VJ963_01005 [Bacteroidales bacterium]|nr:hypothetical protein [Bacteroidales bacterium]
MKKSLLVIITALFLFSCNQNNNKASGEKALRHKVLDVATAYVKEILGATKETISQNGIITITENKSQFVSTEDNSIKYIINPGNIHTGLIDDDDKEDAIITLNSFKGQYEEAPENLILLNTGDNLVLGRVIESDMRIIDIKDRLITAEISTHSRNSPLRDCNSCKEVVKYRFNQGDLIESEPAGSKDNKQ